MSLTYGVRSVRPSRSGKRGVVVLELRLVDEDGETLQEGEFKLLVKCREPGSAPTDEP